MLPKVLRLLNGHWCGLMVAVKKIIIFISRIYLIFFCRNYCKSIPLLRNINSKIIMKKLLLFSFLQIVILNSFGQSSPWTILKQTQIKQLPAFSFSDMPSTGCIVFSLDRYVLNALLADAPKDTVADSSVIANFPNIDGVQDGYNIFEVALTKQAFANNSPIIKSYIGKAINDKTQVIRFGTAPIGFDAVANSGKVGSFLIINHRSNSLFSYVVYIHFKAPRNSIYYSDLSSIETNTDFVCAKFAIALVEWQPISDPFYHTSIIDDMQDAMAESNTGILININTPQPIVNTDLDYTIQKDTPNVLKASVNAPHSNGYTYFGESLDMGI